MFKYKKFIKKLQPICRKHVGEINKKLNLNSESVIFDVGSNIGLFTLAICESHPYKKVFLFEPVREYFEASKKLLKAYSNLTFVNKGASDQAQKLTIYKNKNLANIGWNSFLEKDPMRPDQLLPKDKMEPEECELISLSEFCSQNKIEKVDLIKIDVEGFEYLVIAGLLSFLEGLTPENRPYLFVEVGWGTNHPNWDIAGQIYEKLFCIGYKRISFCQKTMDILFEPIQKN